MSHESATLNFRGRRRALRTAGACGALTVALLGSIVSTGSAAAATPTVTCGSTLTADVTLKTNLTCPAGDGLILGSGVTLDLGGHTLTGPGSTGVGVRNADDSLGDNGVRNGRIVGWGTGILVQGTTTGTMTPFTIADVTLRSAPVQSGPSASPVTMTRVTAQQSPIRAELTADIHIGQSKLTQSPVSVFFASAFITDSVLIESQLDASGQGEIRVESSRLDGNGTTALGFLSETIMTIHDSVVKEFSQPIQGFWGGVRLTDSTFTDMPSGVLGDISSNIGSDGVSVITGNTFARSGVVLAGDVPMIVENNVFTRSDTGVVFTRDQSLPGDPPFTAEGSRAVGNELTKNSGSAIYTDLPGLAVGDNVAKRNGGYGIYAPGAIDLGGNVASGNALGQCVGVVCAAK